MTKKDLFEYRDYKAYLNDQIASQPNAGHGIRSKMAAAMGSPVSHVSQVLKGISHLSFEQAEAVNDFFAHSDEESDYFLLLVQRARAGTPALQRRVDRQIRTAIDKRLLLKNRIKAQEAVSLEAQTTYYSSWLYSAVHILLTIKPYQTKEALARRLKLPLKQITAILDFLVSSGLAAQEGNLFKTGVSRLHVGSDSPLVSRHHLNWRMRAMQALEKEANADDLHFSSVISISKEDFLRIKFMLTKELESINNVVKASPEEELFSMCLDFFEV